MVRGLPRPSFAVVVGGNSGLGYLGRRWVGSIFFKEDSEQSETEGTTGKHLLRLLTAHFLDEERNSEWNDFSEIGAFKFRTGKHSNQDAGVRIYVETSLQMTKVDYYLGGFADYIDISVKQS